MHNNRERANDLLFSPLYRVFSEQTSKLKEILRALHVKKEGKHTCN